MQPIRRALLNSLRSSKAVASQCLTTTTSNQTITASHCLKHSRLFTLSARAPVLRSHPQFSPPAVLRKVSTTAPQRQEQPTDSQANLVAEDPAKVGEAVEEADVQRPSYEMFFTCKPCGERSQHTVSKQGYHHGSVLVACPGCKARHLISDHLKIFGESARSLEEILAENGEALQRGHINADGDIEFWPEGAIDANPEGQPEGRIE